MSTIIEPKQTADTNVTFIVTGANFEVHVPINNFNAQFAPDAQVMHAAAVAFEVFKGLRKEPEIKMFPDHKDELPKIGTTMLVHISGTDIEGAALVFSHVVAADCGYYGDSIKLQTLFEQQAHEIGAKLAKDAEAKKVALSEVNAQLFEQLKHKTFPPKEIQTNATKKITKSPRKVRKGK